LNIDFITGKFQPTVDKELDQLLKNKPIEAILEYQLSS